MEKKVTIQDSEVRECSLLVHNLAAFKTVKSIMQDNKPVVLELNVTQADELNAQQRYNNVLILYKKWWEKISEKYKLPKEGEPYNLNLDFATKTVTCIRTHPCSKS